VLAFKASRSFKILNIQGGYMKNGNTKKVASEEVSEFDFAKFLAEKEIIPLIRYPNKRRELESIFEWIDIAPYDSREEKQFFLADLGKITGTAGEWKILSEKFENKQLKALAAKKYQELKKKSTTIKIWEGKIGDLDIIDLSSTPELVQKKEKRQKAS
jgi:hypothetical protein